MSSSQSVILAISVIIAAGAAGLITRDASEQERQEAASAVVQRPAIGMNVHPVTAGPDRCLGCHVKKEDEGLLAATVPGTCKRCHDRAHAGEKTHPEVIEVAEGAEVSLGPDGAAVCDTCHDPHAEGGAMLREKGLMDACSSECHEEMGIQ